MVIIVKFNELVEHFVVAVLVVAVERECYYFAVVVHYCYAQLVVVEYCWVRHY